MDKILEINNLNKEFDYEKFKLQDISFDLDRGYIMGLIGPNGSGKTTIINIIMNILKKNSGEIKIFGKDHLEYEKEVKDRIGFVYDKSSYYEELSCNEMKDLIAPFYSKWDDDQFYKYMDTFKVESNKKIKELSKGMKMKFSLAIALSHHAELIIMDEPTDGLDPISRREALNIMQRVVEDGNTSFLLSTHLTADLDKVADYITYINKGKLIVSTDKETFIDSYKVIKGSLSDLEIIGKDLILGINTNEIGFDGLIESKNIEKIDNKGVLLDIPSIEDIMYYTGRDLK